MKLFTPFGSHIFRGLRLSCICALIEEGGGVKPRSRRGYCKFMQSASHTLTLLECTNGSRRIVHSSERVYCIPRPSASRCSACQAHATQFPQEMSERAPRPLSQSAAVGPHSLRSHIMALKSILAISFAVRSLPDSLRACTASQSGIVFSAAEADPAQHSFVPLRRPQGHFAETTNFFPNSGEWRRRLEEIH